MKTCGFECYETISSQLVIQELSFHKSTENHEIHLDDLTQFARDERQLGERKEIPSLSLMSETLQKMMEQIYL
jgi:hypothetical protein